MEHNYKQTNDSMENWYNGFLTKFQLMSLDFSKKVDELNENFTKLKNDHIAHHKQQGNLQQQ